jgi:hypothetical protein
MKKCFKCSKIQPMAEFYDHPAMGDGKLGKCKTCAKADVKARYALTRKERSAYEAKRFKEPGRKATITRAQRKMRAIHPEKYAARNAVSNAVRDGRLVRGPCVHCGTTKKVQGHHHDYSKPLDVEWCCFKCHREREHGQVVSSE